MLWKGVESLDELEVWSLGFSEEWGRWDWEGVYEGSFVQQVHTLSTQYWALRVTPIDRMKHNLALKELMVLL